MQGGIMTRDDALALPPVVSLATAAELLGLGRSAAYELVRTGQWPTPILRLGRLIKVPTAPLITLVGIATEIRATAS
jgi:predicted DNA-binding transcriptional regulator AlpA